MSFTTASGIRTLWSFTLNFLPGATLELCSRSPSCSVGATLIATVARTTPTRRAACIPRRLQAAPPPPRRGAATMSQVQLALWRPSWRNSLTCVLAACLLVLSKDWNQGLARPSRVASARRPHEPPTVSLGDLEDPHVLHHALSESAASSGRLRRNVILMVTDFEHQHWAHNLLLNLRSSMPKCRSHYAAPQLGSILPPARHAHGAAQPLKVQP